MKYFILTILAVFGFFILLHVLGVIGTVATAPGRVVNKTLQTDNIITNYEWFYDANAQYETRVGQVKEYEGYLADATEASEKTHLRIDLGAIRQSCRDLVTKYNANSEKANRSFFKSKNLPVTLPINSCEAK